MLIFIATRTSRTKMAKISVYNLKGEKKEELEVTDKVFGLPENDTLLHQVFVSLMANKRQSIADTKNRGDRAGSGIKPWKQKGTGRARVGSSRTPTWKGGGVAFGPKSERNYKQKINKKMNSKAITLALSGKFRDGEIFVLENLDLKEKKTKSMSAVLKSLKIKGSVLMGFHTKEKEMVLTARNLKKVDCVLSESLSVLDILNHKNIILSKESVKSIEKKYSKESLKSKA
jgi:large subunit ribosomal protein L4